MNKECSNHSASPPRTRSLSDESAESDRSTPVSDDGSSYFVDCEDQGEADGAPTTNDRVPIISLASKFGDRNSESLESRLDSVHLRRSAASSPSTVSEDMNRSATSSPSMLSEGSVNNSYGYAMRHIAPGAKLNWETESEVPTETESVSVLMNDSSSEGSSSGKAVRIVPEQPPKKTWGEFLGEQFKWLDADYVKRKVQYVYLVMALYIVPITAALKLPLNVVSFLYFFGLFCIGFVNFWMLFEAIASVGYTERQRKLHRSKPEIKGQRHVAAIIAAYLPNELTVLCDTVRAISAQIHHLPEDATLDIVLAHNGGKLEQRCMLLEDLRKLEGEIPERVQVHELNVVTSRSKARNVNSGLAFLQELGEDRGYKITQVAMYDADHQPIPTAYRWALETMQDQKASMVMGRCCVQDGFKFIAVEFDILYGVAHAGGRCIRGFGFFGGSNGYWDFQTLIDTGMDETMLTEDVDSSFRAQAAGHIMTYDPTIVSYEESPPSLQALFKQRLRWSQGWAEVTWRQRTLWFRPAPGLTLWSRFCIFLVLPFREAYLYISSFTVPIAVVSLSRTCGLACVDPRLFVFMLFCLLVPVFMTIIASKVTLDNQSKIHYRMQSLTRKDYKNYILVSYGYELAKIHWAVLGHARNFLGLNKWVVTARKNTKSEEQAIYEPRRIPIDNPETLVEDSPYATTPRRLFSQSFHSSPFLKEQKGGH